MPEGPDGRGTTIMRGGKMIVRTPQRAEGGITVEEKNTMDLITQKWIKNALRTDSIVPEKIIPTIEKLYEVSGLKKPRVIIVSSPLVMAFAYGAAAWIWYCRKNFSTYQATARATDEATAEATYQATYQATAEATDEETYAATDAATDEATDEAIHLGAIQACFKLAGIGGLECAKKWWRSYQGGNMWGGISAYFEAMRDILKLELPEFSKYQAWEDCSREGGFRILHPEFCIVSDFPEILKMNDQNQPHCEDGPSHRWRDGWELYHLNGVKVRRELVMTPADKLDPKMILTEQNVEIRREIIRKIGIERCLEHLNAKILDTKGDYELVSIDLGMERRSVGLKMKNPSIGVWHLEFVPFTTKTVQEAINFRAGRLKHHKGNWNPSILT